MSVVSNIAPSGPDKNQKAVASAPAQNSDGAQKRATEVTHDQYQIADVLQVGETLVLQKKIGRQTFRATLAGWILGEAILAALPLSIIASGQLFKDDLLLVRQLALGRVCGYETMVLKVLTDPACVVLEWPLWMEFAQISAEERVRARMPVILQAANSKMATSGQPLAGVLCELSLGGCRIRVHRLGSQQSEWNAGDLLLMDMSPFGEGRLDGIVLEVRNMHRQRSYIELGCRFMPDQDDIKDILRSLLPVQIFR